MIKQGDSNLNKIYLGNTEITKAYIGDTQIYPNASVETRVVATYNITSTSEPTTLCASVTNVSAMEVDGVDSTVATSYTFPTTGNHTVKFTLTDGTTINQFMFYASSNVSNLTSLYIPDGVTTIGNLAFYGNNNLTSVRLPDSITTFNGDSHLMNCFSLTSVNIPTGITEIPIAMFEDCTSLTNVIIPNNVTYINTVAFHNCGFTSIGPLGSGADLQIPDGTSWDVRAFEHCHNLTSVTIPDYIAHITDSSFENCTSLTSVTFSACVTGIDNGAFKGCTSLRTINIPDNVEDIDNNAFYGCTSLTNVTIGTGIQNIGDNIFQDCSSMESLKIEATTPPMLNSLESYNSTHYPILVHMSCLTDFKEAIGWDRYESRIVPIESVVTTYDVTSTSEATTLLNSNSEISYQIIDGVQQSSVQTTYTFSTTGKHIVAYGLNIDNIASSAFSNCTKLTNVILPDGVISIGQRAFQDCTSLTSVIIPNGVTSIGQRAFRYCYDLTSITIPDSAVYIEGSAFANCTGLTSITIEKTTPPQLGSSAFDNTNNCPIYVPAESVAAYKRAYSTYESRIQAIQ